MPVIENMAPPAYVMAAPAQGGEPVSVDLPDRIPSTCVFQSGRDYSVSPFVLLAILKVESNGRTGVVGQNTNGTEDLGPSQFNSGSWAKVLIEKYKIPREALLNDMCQSVRALAFAVRTEVDAAGGDLWKGIGNYHSRSPVHHQKYVRLVFGAYKQMAAKGRF
jgi:hypothetical protein